MPNNSKLDFESVKVNIQFSQSYFPNFDCAENMTVLVSKDSSYQSVLEAAGFPVNDIGFISVNGIKKEKDEFVSENDIIRPFPLIICG